MYEPRFIKPTYLFPSSDLDDDDDDDDDDEDDDAGNYNEETIELVKVPRRPKYKDSFNDEEDDNDDEHVNNNPRQQQLSSLEVVQEQHQKQKWNYNVWNRWEEPCTLSISITAIFVVPTLLLCIHALYVFSGRLWGIWPIVLHIQLRLSNATFYIQAMTTTTTNNKPVKNCNWLRITCSILTCIELLLFGSVYPQIANGVIQALFTDYDGTIVYEWVRAVKLLSVIQALGYVICGLRLAVGIPTLLIRTIQYWSPNHRQWRPTFWTPHTGENTHQLVPKTFQGANRLVWALNLFCLLSALSHFGPWPMWTIGSIPNGHSICDPLDTTECALPFPSFHHMRPDTTTPTGWRVDLKGLPALRGGIPFHPKFLSELDGFSTMAPILFYMDGLKEAHEHGNNRVALQGPDRIEYSVTDTSITFLINVDNATLVPHSAEVDYWDATHPVIMVIPSQPLHHQTHYAVAVVNAADRDGNPLAQTSGMKDLLRDRNNQHLSRYTQKVIPALEQAAPWISSADNTESIQMLFDFVTISEQAQIGTIRTVRDIALDVVKDPRWDWQHHVETVSVEDYNCNEEGATIARTVHIALDVPWFLKSTHSRYSTLDHFAIDQGRHVTIGKAKGMIQMPCSVKNAAYGDSKNGKAVRAIMEYGHGLFGNRGEVQDGFLGRMANDNGYIQIAMDWRGMSSYDLAVIIKVLIGKPNLFKAVRDNLIQGYANKLAFQHFSQNGMLDWLSFGDGVRIPTLNDQPPVSVFYGISQGGILGAGYVSWAAKTKLIDRAILGVPGTPLALVMTRSLDVLVYDKLLLMSFYNNRHVRIMLTLCQMGWDSVESSGLLAAPVSEPIPPVLIQAGLGDPIVPTIAAEALTRAMGGSTLPSSPREIYGVPSEAADVIKSGAVLTELLYEYEYNGLPLDDVPPEENAVHYCVRLDEELIKQVEEFTNTGVVIDPCEKDGCRRQSAVC